MERWYECLSNARLRTDPVKTSTCLHRQQATTWHGSVHGFLAWVRLELGLPGVYHRGLIPDGSGIDLLVVSHTGASAIVPKSLSYNDLWRTQSTGRRRSFPEGRHHVVNS